MKKAGDTGCFGWDTMTIKFISGFCMGFLLDGGNRDIRVIRVIGV
jgi:hypothetical protein